jgi:hypothetical protein
MVEKCVYVSRKVIGKTNLMHKLVGVSACNIPSK